MATFLQLVQKAARESNTISGTVGSVADTNPRVVKVVNWVADALVRVENLHRDWRWMRKEFTGATVADQASYDASTDWSITNFGEWRRDNVHTGERPFSIYLTATGVSDEGIINEMDWAHYRNTFVRGSQTSNRPSWYSIGPDNKVYLGAIPDLVYTVRGEYTRTAQVLALNGDTPDMPARFHDIIVWEALRRLHANDEGVFSTDEAEKNYNILLSDLERDQLPPVSLGAPLA